MFAKIEKWGTVVLLLVLAVLSLVLAFGGEYTKVVSVALYFGGVLHLWAIVLVLTPEQARC